MQTRPSAVNNYRLRYNCTKGRNLNLAINIVHGCVERLVSLYEFRRGSNIQFPEHIERFGTGFFRILRTYWHRHARAQDALQFQIVISVCLKDNNVSGNITRRMCTIGKWYRRRVCLFKPNDSVDEHTEYATISVYGSNRGSRRRHRYVSIITRSNKPAWRRVVSLVRIGWPCVGINVKTNRSRNRWTRTRTV